MSKKEVIIDEEFQDNYKKESDLLQRKINDFITDMRELGQTELYSSGPGYEISFKISKQEPN